MGNKTLDNVIVEHGANIMLTSFQYSIRELFNKETFEHDVNTTYGVKPVFIETFLKEQGSSPVIEFEIPDDYEDIDGIKLIWKGRCVDMSGEIPLKRTNQTLSANIADIPNYGMGDTVAILYHKDDILLCHLIQ